LAVTVLPLVLAPETNQPLARRPQGVLIGWFLKSFPRIAQTRHFQSSGIGPVPFLSHTECEIGYLNISYCY
jgi:hypothetical protein